MAQQTAIGWTDLSWNPTHGCSRVSTGCLHCYAETLSLRYGQTPAPWTERNVEQNVTLKPHKLREPLSRAKAWQGLGQAAAAAGKTDGKLVFVNSMSDLFHEQIPDEYIARVFTVMAAAERHTFQVLTKRPERMAVLLSSDAFVGRVEVARDALEGRFAVRPWPLPNVWLGVSIENRKWVGRADVLRQVPAAVRFISAEPLLGPLTCEGIASDAHPTADGCGQVFEAWPDWPDGYRGARLNLSGIDWLIVGGESGKGHRPMQLDWARDLRDAAQATRIGDERPDCAFFFKQSSGPRPGTGRILDGRTWDEFPRVHEASMAA